MGAASGKVTRALGSLQSVIDAKLQYRMDNNDDVYFSCFLCLLHASSGTAGTGAESVFCCCWPVCAPYRDDLMLRHDIYATNALIYSWYRMLIHLIHLIG